MSPKKKPRAKSARARRREAARVDTRIADLREKLFRSEPGSSERHPFTVASASVIETHARSVVCPRCEGALRFEEHLAETIDDRRLRRVRVTCRECGSKRSLWYEIEQPN